MDPCTRLSETDLTLVNSQDNPWKALKISLNRNSEYPLSINRFFYSLSCVLVKLSLWERVTCVHVRLPLFVFVNLYKCPSRVIQWKWKEIKERKNKTKIKEISYLKSAYLKIKKSTGNVTESTNRQKPSIFSLLLADSAPRTFTVGIREHALRSIYIESRRQSIDRKRWRW